MTQLSVGIAVVGFAFGMSVGNRFSQTDRNAPVSGGIIGAVIFFLIADALITIAVFAFCSALIVMWWRQRQSLHRVIMRFSDRAGLRLASDPEWLPFSERVSQLHFEHEARVSAVRRIGLHMDDEEQLLEVADARFTHRLKRMLHDDY